MPRHRYSEADREVGKKSEEALERETAEKWASRALACYHRYVEGHGLSWYLRGESYRHEALEHAALAGDGGKLVGKLTRRIDAARPRVRSR